MFILVLFLVVDDGELAFLDHGGFRGIHGKFGRIGEGELIGRRGRRGSGSDGADFLLRLFCFFRSSQWCTPYGF
jgi:hypothetical protein